VDVQTVDMVSHAMCPEADVPLDQAMSQQLPQQLPEPVHVVPRLYSLDSINALMWPMSRRVSSAGSRTSDHLHLYVDNGGDHLHLYVDQPQLQQGLPPQPSSHPRLRSTASINALVWPVSRSVSRPDSSRSGSSHATAVDELASVAEDAPTAASQPAMRPLPSAASIDSLLWPGNTPIEQRAVAPAEHAEVQARPSAASPVPIRLSAVATAEVPVRASSSFRAQKQQSLLDRAAAKKALASLLAAAKASQIRGWSPKQRALSPVPAPEEVLAPVEAVPVKSTVGLPSLEDIEALVPLEEDRSCSCP